MSKTTFDKIAAGLADALAYAGGDDTRGRIASPLDVKAVRLQANKTQAQFADAFHIPVATLRDWEQGRREPNAAAKTLIKVAELHPTVLRRIAA